MLEAAKKMNKTILKEHFIRGSGDINNIPESQIEVLASELFSTSPIPFVPRKDHEVDRGIQKALLEKSITLPVVWIKDNLYLVGT